MSEIRERAKDGLIVLQRWNPLGTDLYQHDLIDGVYQLVTDLLAELERVEKERNDAMREASSLAKWLHKTCYALTAPGWSLCDTPAGVITQIDNMISGIPDLVHSHIKDRIAELEAENARLKALEDKMGSGCALVEYAKARTQAARECVEIIDKYPAFLFGTDAVGVKLNLSQSIKARFGLDG